MPKITRLEPAREAGSRPARALHRRSRVRLRVRVRVRVRVGVGVGVRVRVMVRVRVPVRVRVRVRVRPLVRKRATPGNTGPARSRASGQEQNTFLTFSTVT